MYSTSYIHRCLLLKEKPDIGFANFMTLVDNKVFQEIGFYLEDLPDQMFMDMYQENFTVDQVANIVIDDYKNFVY